MHRRLFVLGILFETALLGIAMAWGAIFGERVLSHIRWNLKDAAIGAAAALPLLVFFVWTMKSKLPVWVRHRELMESVIARLFGDCGIWQLAALSVCAGVCEEALFRGAIQSSLAGCSGDVAALITASLLFGGAHLLSWTYGIIAAAIGFFLGLLFLFSGNLLIPVTTHALYDFLALVYALRFHRSRGLITQGED